MMTCEDFVPFIDAFVDGEFDERERAEMEVHLDSCETCREQVRFQVRLKEEFKASLTESAPDALREQIFSGIAGLSAAVDSENESTEVASLEEQGTT